MLKFFFEGDDFFHSLQEDISAAVSRVDVELYYFASDAVGWDFAHLFLKEASEGVKVRLLYDAIGCRSTSEEIFAALREGGVETKVYNPVFPLSESSRRRTHRKIVVIDDRVAYVGGFNIAAEYSAQCAGAKAWRDSGVRIDDPTLATQLRGWIDVTWEGPRMSWKELRRRRPFRPDWTRSKLHIIPNHGWLRKSFIREEYLAAIIHAKERIWITNSYFIPDRGILRALRRAAHRGVDVQIVTAGRSDVPLALWASRAVYTRLLKAGVKIHEYRDRVLHAKTALVDREWFTVGTANIDHLSFFRNLEINLFGHDEAAVQVLAQQFLSDVGRSETISLESWKKRSLWDRFVERFFFLFRVWL